MRPKVIARPRATTRRMLPRLSPRKIVPKKLTMERWPLTALSAALAAATRAGLPAASASLRANLMVGAGECGGPGVL
jgi:DNA-binding IclR family transcriptional regulator